MTTYFARIAERNEKKYILVKGEQAGLTYSNFVEAGGLDNNGKPFLNGMLRTLTSAKILLPGIKDLLEKYPKCLRENADKLSQEDKERYQKQQDLFGVKCKDLEEEQPEDSSEMKEERFMRVLDNIYKLQEFGQPPDDVIEDIAQLPGLGAAGECPKM